MPSRDACPATETQPLIRKLPFRVQGDEIEKLQLQVVLLERIGEALTVLNTPDMRKNAKRILEEAGGRFDLILTPNAPRRTSAIDNSSAPAPPTTFPPRVAVVSSELTTRKLVAAAVTNGTNAELATFETLAEAANDSAPVIVVCVCEETPLVPPAQLSRTMPAGGRRSYVFVGELDTAEQDMVHVTGTGWCETVRGRAAAPRAPGAAAPAAAQALRVALRECPRL